MWLSLVETILAVPTPPYSVPVWDTRRSTSPCPAVVKEYNRNMGGVDLLGSLIALCWNKIRSKKWYHQLVFQFPDMITVTTWLLF